MTLGARVRFGLAINVQRVLALVMRVCSWVICACLWLNTMTARAVFSGDARYRAAIANQEER
jgi:hypothetical protein